jgi:peptidase E
MKVGVDTASVSSDNLRQFTCLTDFPALNLEKYFLQPPAESAIMTAHVHNRKGQECKRTPDLTPNASNSVACTVPVA